MGLKVVLDANCFIGAGRSAERDFPSLRKIFAARDAGRITICISLHTLNELKTAEALALGHTATRLPHFAVGGWGDQVATWGQVSHSTWADHRAAAEKYEDLRTLAKAGADIRDLGAYGVC